MLRLIFFFQIAIFRFRFEISNIYNTILKEKDKALIIGDNLRTDIKGANLIKQDSLFITDGVHKSEIKGLENLSNILKKYEVETNFIQEKLHW